ncbi:unannotated protein [freshwater metagenome]|uniref:Unannotated protein n=1 Tax=freshwater metagenome TaxID=449393 RepID=A0A6J6EKU2_9ZZZZ
MGGGLVVGLAQRRVDGGRPGCAAGGGRVEERRLVRARRDLGERRLHRGTRRVPLVGPAGEEAVDQLGQPTGQGRPQAGDVRGVALQTSERGVGVVLPEERHAPGEALVEHEAERVEVRATVEPLAAHLLRRQVLRRAHHDVVVGEVVPGGLEALGDAEVGEQHPTVGGDEDVPRLDVAVHHARLVRGVECGRDARTDVDGELGAQLLLLVEQLAQALAVDELHHDRLAPAVLDRVVHGDDVRVVELRDGDRLATEPLGDDGVAREVRFQELDRHLA